MYVVCLLFYAIGDLICFYICLSPFPKCSEAPLGEWRLFYFAISWRWTLPMVAQWIIGMSPAVC